MDKLEISLRDPGNAHKARNKGFVPAIIYGGEGTPVAIKVPKRDLKKQLQRGRFTVRQFELVLDGKNHHVLPREVQSHPVSGEPLHVDFMRVTDKTRVTIEVAVDFANEEASPGLKRGGVLNVVRHAIEVSCMVANMPQKFTADLAGLDIGDSVHVSNIDLPEGVKPTIDDRDFTIATIAPPTVMQEPTPEETAEAAEGEEGEAEAEDKAEDKQEPSKQEGEEKEDKS